MADENPRGRQDRLPIKLIMPNQGTERRVAGGGSKPKPFREVSPQYRQGLSNQVSAIQEALAPQLQITQAAPVRVVVLAKAAAKSHRPETLFSEQTCPIVGSGRLGELFIKATSDGLKRLNDAISHNTSEKIVKELSCVESIEAITPALRRHGRSAEDILRRSPGTKGGYAAKAGGLDIGLYVQDDPSSSTGKKLVIVKGTDTSNTITVHNFNLADAQDLNKGYLGIKIDPNVDSSAQLSQ